MATLTEYFGSENDYENAGISSPTSGQSFQVDMNGTATSIGFIGSAGNTASGTFKFEIKTGSTEGTVIATTGSLNTTATLSAFGSGTLNQVNLTAGVSLSTGVDYYLVLTPLTGSSNDEVRWTVDTTAPTYANGSYYSSITATTSKDRCFAIYGNVEGSPRKLIKDKLNELAGVSDQTVLTCLNLLSSTESTNEQDAWNAWAGTTGLRKQDCANIIAGTTGLRIQDALESI